MLCVFNVPTDSGSAVAQNNSHVCVACEMRVRRVSLVVVSVLLVLARYLQSEHLVSELEWFRCVFAALDYFRFDVDRLVYNSGVVETSALRLVLYTLIAGEERNAELALYYARSGLGARRTGVCR